ncbi:MAG: outer membrane lipoprotein-sorting protein [Myxococcota bacterium]
MRPLGGRFPSVVAWLALVALAAALPAVARGGEAEAARWLEGAAAALHPAESMSARALLWTRDAEGDEEVLLLDWLRWTRDGTRQVVLEVRQPEAMQGSVYQLAFPGGATVDRRVWSPERGRLNRMRGDRPTDPFLGSFFTYEDLGWVRLALGVPLRERRHSEAGDGRVTIETGPYALYLGAELVLDAASGLPLRVGFRDRAGFEFRQLRFSDVREVDGRRLPHRIEVEDLLSGVRSRLELDDVHFGVPVDPWLFEPDFGGRPLRRGTRIDVPLPGDAETDGGPSPPTP